MKNNDFTRPNDMFAVDMQLIIAIFFSVFRDIFVRIGLLTPINRQYIEPQANIVENLSNTLLENYVSTMVREDDDNFIDTIADLIDLEEDDKSSVSTEEGDYDYYSNLDNSFETIEEASITIISNLYVADAVILNSLNIEDQAGQDESGVDETQLDILNFDAIALNDSLMLLGNEIYDASDNV